MSIREKIEKKNLPHGIHILEPDNPSGSEPSKALEPSRSEPEKTRLGINRRENPAEDPTSWSYLFLQHMAARNFLKWLKRYNKGEEGVLIPLPSQRSLCPTGWLEVLTQ